MRRLCILHRAAILIIWVISMPNINKKCRRSELHQAHVTSRRYPELLHVYVKRDVSLKYLFDLFRSRLLPTDEYFHRFLSNLIPAIANEWLLSTHE